MRIKMKNYKFAEIPSTPRYVRAAILFFQFVLIRSSIMHMDKMQKWTAGFRDTVQLQKFHVSALIGKKAFAMVKNISL